MSGDAPKAIGTYECYCPHCGAYGKQNILEKSSNMLGWDVLQLECVNEPPCGLFWEIWIYPEEDE